jgi:hypothetical protein
LKERTKYIFPLAPLKENPEKRLVTQNKENILEKEAAKKKALKTRELKKKKTPDEHDETVSVRGGCQK